MVYREVNATTISGFSDKIAMRIISYCLI